LWGWKITNTHSREKNFRKSNFPARTNSLPAGLLVKILPAQVNNQCVLTGLYRKARGIRDCGWIEKSFFFTFQFLLRGRLDGRCGILFMR
jgi:hypothetical protein